MKGFLSILGTVAIMVAMKMIFFPSRNTIQYPMIIPAKSLATRGAGQIYEDPIPCSYTVDTATLNGKRLTIRIPCDSKKTTINPSNDLCAFMKPIDTASFQVVEVSQDLLNAGVTKEHVLNTLSSKSYGNTIGGVDSVKRVNINGMDGICMYKKDNQTADGEHLYFHYIIYMLIYNKSMLTIKYCVGSRKREELFAELYFKKLEPIWQEMIYDTAIK
jgi:hypothetical protein